MRLMYARHLLCDVCARRGIMIRLARPFVVLILVLACAVAQRTSAQTSGEKEQFTATAIINNNLGSGAGTVLINVDRWSTEAERTMLVATLLDKGPRELLDKLMDQRSVGTRSEEHTSELQSRLHLVCRLLLEKRNPKIAAGRGLRSHRHRVCQILSYA